MAPTFVFVLFLSLFLRASFSLPIALDVKTVQPNSETMITERTVLDAEIILNLDEKTKFGQSLTTETVPNAFESVEAVHGKRIKRDIFNTKKHCPEDRFPYGDQCLSKEQFDEYNDGPEGADY